MDTIDTTTAIAPIEGVEPIIETGETAFLKTETGTYVFVPVEGETDVMAHYLQQINCQFITAQKPESFEKMIKNHQVIFISNDVIEVEHEIYQLQQALDNKSEIKKIVSPKENNTKNTIHSSLFSLAKTIYQKKPRTARTTPVAQSHSNNKTRSDISSPYATIAHPKVETPSKEPIKSIYRVERDDSQQQGRQGQQHDQQQKHAKDKLNKKVSRAEKTSATSIERPADDCLTDMNHIFIRFMDLMARILGQAEAEAHELYQKIKHRTDQVDTLTSLIQKINNETGEINWNENPQMLQLIQQAREIGVEIPEGKTEWTVEEKRLLKENISMRKDSMEKITQLERTDMQRYLQEASQCHQARSNILKLLKEVLDTIIHNIRP